MANLWKFNFLQKLIILPQRNLGTKIKSEFHLVNTSTHCYRIYSYDKMLYLHYFDIVFRTNDF